jgi:hypothetical protein
MFCKIFRKNGVFKMKNKLFWVCAVLVIIGFASCSTTGEGSAAPQSDITDVTTPDTSRSAAGEGSAVPQSSITDVTTPDTNQGFINDRRFDGTWQSADQTLELEFYANTYILYWDGEAEAAGLFNYTDSAIDYHTQPGMHSVLYYSLSGSTLTVNSADGLPDSFIGQWKKIAAPISDAANPLVGTWRIKTGEGFSFYQFYSDGSGRTYDANTDLTSMTAKGDVRYDLNVSKVNIFWRDGNGEIISSILDASFELNGDTIIHGEFVLERQ